MAESDSSSNRNRGALVAAIALIAGGIAWWYSQDPVSEPQDATPVIAPSAEISAKPAPAVDPPAAEPEHRIENGGRLSLDASELPADGPLELALELDKEISGDGRRTVRVVSTDGRRIDLVTKPLPAGAVGVELEIDPSFLNPGRYLIEIDTVGGAHPLKIRRYVLEVR